MAELEMLPAWAGRLAEPSHPPQPPTPPRRHATEDSATEDSATEDSAAADSANGGADGVNGAGSPVAANGHGPPAVLTGQPPLPSGEHRIEPAAAATTSELPVVTIPFEDETPGFDSATAAGPEHPLPAVNPLVDTVEVPVDDMIVDAELVDEPDDAAAEPADEPRAELVGIEDDGASGIDGVEAEAADWDDEPAGHGEAPRGEGLLDEGDQPQAGHASLDEIVYEPDEIELLEDTDPIGISPPIDPSVVIPTIAADAGGADGRARPAERDRPVLRVLGLLALALVVVAAGVAAGYLFVALTGS